MLAAGTEVARARGLLFVSLVAIGSLLAFTAVGMLIQEAPADVTLSVVWYLLFVLPLLLVLPGMLRLRARSFVLATLAAMLYFCYGVVLAVDPAHRVLGILEAVAAVALVIAATFAARLLREEDAPQ